MPIEHELIDQWTTIIANKSVTFDIKKVSDTYYYTCVVQKGSPITTYSKKLRTRKEVEEYFITNSPSFLEDIADGVTM